MIYYIKNDSLGGISYPEGRVLGRSAYGAIKNLCMKHLFSLEGYLKAVKETLNLGYKIPIIVSEEIVFFHTGSLKSYESIFINFFAIESIESKGENLWIHFSKDETLEIPMKMEEYKRIERAIFNIFKYKESLV
ncbi:competence protein ComK [Acholeplasma equirhinis]|uniref:competence protein ComK n=1 Tax=Acholeplasma equirhinis TaxID=555393 RepID=UPI00197AD6C5|nr:competence protein ComK [Acholeplasma equirhinis]MBN3491155.1 competence protein ComK [Acholeplasma equirhinis]